MAKVYLQPGDRVETLCEVVYAENDTWKDPRPLPDTPLRLFLEDERHPDGGEWFQVRPDFGGTRGSNPHWGEYCYDDEEPGY